jgi:hypothetical protein
MLQFVNWRSVNAAFCAIMWMVAFVLAVVIVVHGLPSAPSVHHAARYTIR